MSHLIFVGGKKGGIGKSMVSALLAESLLNRGTNTLLIEGDREVSDVGRRYARSGLTVAPLSLSDDEETEEKTIRLFNALEEHCADREVILINCPAGVTARLDSLAVDMRETCNDLGFTLSFIHLMDDSFDCAEGARESSTSGICSISDRKVIVKNERFGDPARWPFAGLEEEWVNGGGEVYRMTKMSPTAAGKISVGDNRNHTLAELLGGQGDLTAAERGAVRRWLRTCAEIPEAVFSQGDAA